ncbi:Putative ubiquitin-like-specific protease 1B [Arachis hypogaea]|nr:Putative ubiquitin-like-specific protease 1B [Arachis hypogaea]
MDRWSKVRFWRRMKEDSIYYWSERTSAHCCPGTGSPATSFSGCVQPLMTQNRCDLRMTFTVFLPKFWKLCCRRGTWIHSERFPPLVMWGWVLTSVMILDFDKIAASMRKWWFAPVCIDRHWWLYAFEIAQKRLWVLDSMNTGEPNNERLKIHAYAGRLIEDMAKVAMPAYEHTENGLPHFYASVPQQDSGCDCGVFVIKFMQFWGLDKPLQH